MDARTLKSQRILFHAEPGQDGYPGLVGQVISPIFRSLETRLRLGLVIAFVMFATAALGAQYVRTSQTSTFVDFEAYYAGATALRQGGPLYARALAYRDAGYTMNHPGMPEPVAGMPYAYPAAFAIAFVPLSLLPIEAATITWFTLVFCSLIGAAYVLAGLLLPAPRIHRILSSLGLSVLLVYFQPGRSNLATGQVELPLFFLLTLTLSSFARDQRSRAGLWLALAAAVKPTFGFLLLFFLWKRAYRATAVAGLLMVALYSAPPLLFGADLLWDFLAVAAHWSSAAWAVAPINQSPYGMLLRLLAANPYTVPVIDSPTLASILRWTMAGLTLVALALTVSRSQTQSTVRVSLEFGLTVAAMLIVAPLAQDIYFIHLAIPLLAIAATVAGRWSLRSVPVLLTLGTGLVYVYLSLPSLRLASQGFYRFYEAPISWPMLLWTGAHSYALIAVAVLTAAALLWQGRLLDEHASRAGHGPLGASARSDGDKARYPRASLPGPISGVHTSLVIPAYNEETRLPGTLEQVLAYLAGQQKSFEILVVDDGSTDRTCEAVKQVATRDGRVRLIREPHRGKGAAVRAGALAAEGQLVIFCDADLSQPVNEFTRLAARFKDADVVIASREAEGARRTGEPDYRHRMGRVFNLIVRLLAVPGVRDTQCGLKCFSQQAARKIFIRQTVDGFGFDVEVLFLARKLGFRTIEVPVDWHHVPGSRVHPVRDSLRMLADVIRVRLNDIRGLYEVPLGHRTVGAAAGVPPQPRSGTA